MTRRYSSALVLALETLGRELALHSSRCEAFEILVGQESYSALMRAYFEGSPRNTDVLGTAEEIEFRFPPITPSIVVRLRPGGVDH